MDEKEREKMLGILKEFLDDYKTHKEEKAKQVPVPPTEPKKEEKKEEKKQGFFDWLFG